MTIATDKRQQVSQKIASAVSTLMDEREIYREDLQDRDIVGLVMDAIAKESLFVQFATLTNEEIKKHCDWVMALESWGSISKQMPVDELKDLRPVSRRSTRKTCSDCSNSQTMRSRFFEYDFLDLPY